MERRYFLALCAAAGVGLPNAAAAPSPQSGAPTAADGARLTIVTQQQAPALSMGLGEARIVISSERSNGAWWLGHFREDPGFRTGLHIHPIQDEHFYVLDGVLSVYLNGAWNDLTAGEYALAPRGVAHAQMAGGEKAVFFMGGGNPAGFEKFFPAAAELAARMKPSDPQWVSEVTKIVSRYDTKVLGPAPPRS
jgi:mannose-6-phosphate isomerase-like protein (cupin superfamily)